MNRWNIPFSRDKRRGREREAMDREITRRV
jgi:hypothetical protein